MSCRYIAKVDPSEIRTVYTDVAIIGSGIAGMYTALQCAHHSDVTMICKEALRESNTRYAQGGIAAVMTESDSSLSHIEDTLFAGAGLNNRDAVAILVREAPHAVDALLAVGTEFDRDHGELALTQEGAHSHRRILHANGDATGAEIVRALADAVENTEAITIREHCYAVDLITDIEGSCIGVLCRDASGKFFFLHARMTVLASGGAGHLYRYTTNPKVATADGIGMAYRAGAKISDMEFVQFHPTVFSLPGAERFLISEAVRGEGAIIRNHKGERFMPAIHPLAELAPRDVVARAILAEAQRTGQEFVYLDITHQPADFLQGRFPNIYSFCMSHGIDMSKDWIPVAPAAHYMMGGVRTDLNGLTSVDRLYAVGEVSCSGVHGANRLASNSLSEAIVFGKRIAQQVETTLEKTTCDERLYCTPKHVTLGKNPTSEDREHLQRVMMAQVGVRRSRESLESAMRELAPLTPYLGRTYEEVRDFEMINLLTSALMTVHAASLREESRGGHYRVDFPERNDAMFQSRIVFQRDVGVFKEDC